MTCLHQLIEFANMQLAYRHDERPGESYEALDGKKINLHVSTTRWDFRVQGKSCGFGVGVLVVGSGPFLCLLLLFFPVGETQIWPGFACRRCCGLVPLLVYDLPRDYGTKVFHNAFNLFTCFSQCQDRASERNRRNRGRKKH